MTALAQIASLEKAGWSHRVEPALDGGLCDVFEKSFANDHKLIVATCKSEKGKELLFCAVRRYLQPSEKTFSPLGIGYEVLGNTVMERTGELARDVEAIVDELGAKLGRAFVAITGAKTQ